MEEKGIVARDCPRASLPATEGAPPRQRAAPRHHRPAAVVPRGGVASRQRAAGDKPFLLHVAVHIIQEVKAKVPLPPFSDCIHIEIS